MRDRISNITDPEQQETLGLSLAQFEISPLRDMSPHGARTPKMDEELLREQIAKLRGELPQGAEFILYYMREDGKTLAEAKEFWVKHVNALTGGLF